MPAVIAYIGLGSNLDNPLHQLEQAIKALQQLPNTRLLSTSSCYRSAAQTVSDEETLPDYLNAVACIETGLDATGLLDALQAIELAQGRVRNGERWQARPLDLDILLYGNQTIDTPRLKIPHPEMTRRDFVLIPLLEIAPDIEIPGVTGIDALLARCEGYIVDKLPSTGPFA